MKLTWDHVHIRSPDPEATALWFERSLGAEVIRSMQQGKPRVDLKLGGANIFIADLIGISMTRELGPLMSDLVRLVAGSTAVGWYLTKHAAGIYSTAPPPRPFAWHDVQAAVDACKQSIGATPGLEESTVSDLESLCEEAASGDIEDAQAASVEVCKAIAEDTVPEGAARDQTIAACESAAPPIGPESRWEALEHRRLLTIVQPVGQTYLSFEAEHPEADELRVRVSPVRIDVIPLRLARGPRLAGGPNDPVTAVALALVVGRLRVALGGAVVPHLAADDVRKLGRIDLRAGQPAHLVGIGLGGIPQVRPGAGTAGLRGPSRLRLRQPSTTSEISVIWSVPQTSGSTP